jgi:hypothetical protein
MFKGVNKMKNLTPLKTIRKFCIECSCGSASEVKKCIITNCALYNFRMGKNPHRTGIGNRRAVIRKNVE